MDDFKDYLQREAAFFEQYLRRRFANGKDPEANPEQDAPGAVVLREAMRYSLFAGGKRLRPLLVLGSCRLFDDEVAPALPAALAVEMVHTYSLIHDDLPAMDDDSYRRGRLANHKVYGDGMAILAGDALLTDAFGVLAAAELPAAVRCRLVAGLSRAAGSPGMVAGQAIDLECAGRPGGSREQLFTLHRLKTGALITFSVVAGGLVAGAGKEDIRRLEKYGQAIGLAFQVADDILDETATSRQLGKDAGSDRENDKLTAVSLLGLEAAGKLLAELIAEAEEALAVYGDRGRRLRQLARYVRERQH